MTLKSILKKKSLGILIHPSSLPEGSYCGTFFIPKYAAISVDNFGLEVPLTNLSRLLARLKFGSSFCTAVIKLVTKLAILKLYTYRNRLYEFSKN